MESNLYALTRALIPPSHTHAFIDKNAATHTHIEPHLYGTVIARFMSMGARLWASTIS